MTAPLTISEVFHNYPKPDIWIVHVMSPLREHEPGTYAPILCSRADGITFPGTPNRTDVVTCPDCIRRQARRTA